MDADHMNRFDDPRNVSFLDENWCACGAGKTEKAVSSAKSDSDRTLQSVVAEVGGQWEWTVESSSGVFVLGSSACAMAWMGEALRRVQSERCYPCHFEISRPSQELQYPTS